MQKAAVRLLLLTPLVLVSHEDHQPAGKQQCTWFGPEQVELAWIGGWGGAEKPSDSRTFPRPATGS